MPEASDTVFIAETWYQDNECSIAFIALQGCGAHVRNPVSETTYEVISGHGFFTLDEDKDDSLILMGPGDKITIEAGQGYQDEGSLVMLATSKPPFDPSVVEYLG